MDIETSKLELIKLILNLDNYKSLKKIEDFILNEESDFWDDLTIDEQKKIQKGIEQLNNGKRILFTKVLEEVS